MSETINTVQPSCIESFFASPHVAKVCPFRPTLRGPCRFYDFVKRRKNVRERVHCNGNTTVKKKNKLLDKGKKGGK